MKRRVGFFADNYKKCWDFLNECRWYVVFAVGVFALLFLIGFAFPVFFREDILVFLEEIIGIIEGKGLFEITWMIFSNNMKASFIAFVSGILLGIFPLVTAVVNGYLLGFVAREVVVEEGIFVLWRLLPHGIFELPAVFFSIGVGLKIGADLIKGNKKLKYNFKEGLRFFVFVVFPLLLVAGVIEGFLIWLSV
jgi:stage II sporulation protein M